MKLNDNVENSVWKKLDQTQFNKKMTNIFVLKLAPTAKSLIARHFHLFCGQWNAITWISREKSHFVCPSVNFLKIKNSTNLNLIEMELKLNFTCDVIFQQNNWKNNLNEHWSLATNSNWNQNEFQLENLLCGGLKHRLLLRRCSRWQVSHETVVSRPADGALSTSNFLLSICFLLVSCSKGKLPSGRSAYSGAAWWAKPAIWGGGDHVTSGPKNCQKWFEKMVFIWGFSFK